MIQNSPIEIIERINICFNQWIVRKEIPKVVLESHIFLILKGGFGGPIILIEVFRKHFSAILTSRLIQRYESVLKGTIFGFTQGILGKKVNIISYWIFNPLESCQNNRYM